MKSTRRAAGPTRLRNVIAGLVPKDEFTGKRLHDVMDLCLECKACKAECPSNVDMAKLKYEFLDHYHRANGLPLRNRIFGAIADLNRIGSTLAPVSNWLANSTLNRWLMELFAGIDRRRPLPQFASETFEDWFRKHKTERRRRERRGGVVSRHVQQLQHAQRRHRRDALSGKIRLPSCARRQKMLRPADDLQGHAQPSQGKCRVEHREARALCGEGNADRRLGAILFADAAR